MFKKKPTIKPSATLRSSDRRKLADQIIQDFELGSRINDAGAEQTPEQKADATTARTSLRNSLFPENVQSARFTTTAGPELKPISGTVYIGSQEGGDARILWFAIEGRLCPSVYTLWKNPDIVPLLHTPGIVVKKLQGGADLMTPGLAGGPPFPSKARKGVVVAIASTENPSVPIAVGTCEIDVSALQQVQGAKGHAVQNMHWAGDELWSFSPVDKQGQQVPDEIEGWAKVIEARGLTQQMEALALVDEDEEGGVVLEHGNDASLENADLPNEDLPKSADDDEANATPTVTKELTQAEIDTAFRNAFIFGVHRHKTTNPGQKNFGLVFPLSQSFIMSTLVQPFLPAFTPEESQQLQIKKTSWKTIKKFIKSLDKAKLVKSKDQNGNETVIMDIDFNDEAVVSFRPYRLPQKETMSGTSIGRGEAATEKIDIDDDCVGQKLQVVTFYRPNSKQQPLFDAASGTKTLYAPAEVRELVIAYVDSENLISETNKRLVKLNPIIANAVFDGSGQLDKEVLAKGSVPRDALVDRLVHSMATSYAVLRNGNDSSSVRAKSGTAPKVHITLETRSGNKTITKVSGLEAYYINPRPLADELRKVCAGSTSVEPLAGAAKKNEKEVMEIMVQGPQSDAVVKALERRGVDKRWIEFLDKTKGKKR